MSKKAFHLAFLFLILSLSVVAQTANSSPEYEPAILILSPFKTAAAPEASGQIKEWNDEFQKSERKSEEIDKELAVNLQKMRGSTQTFFQNLDFFKQVTLISQEYLTYRFYKRFPQTLILIKDTIAGPEISSLAQIATSQNMPYILSFPEVRILKEKKNFLANVRVQLYERESNSLLIDKEYRGNDRNPGFEFTCQEGTLNCTLGNALSQALSEIISVVAQNNKTLKAERALAVERAIYIQNSIFQAVSDPTLIQFALGRDSSIDLPSLYHSFYSPNKDKFVGFFQSSAESKGIKEFNSSNKDRNVKILTKKDIKDKDFLKESPETYSFIVKGILQEGKWYYEKDMVTYFTPTEGVDGKLEYLNYLQQWDFFKSGSSIPDDQFWEGKLFAKIPDLTKDPKWEKYKDIWEHREEENREYIGMYELVANKLKGEKEDREQHWKDSLSTSVFQSFYKTLLLPKSTGSISRSKAELKDHLYIYNPSKTVIINPEEFTDAKGNTTLRYFVYLPSEKQIFEWIYFPPFKMQKGDAQDGIMDNLNTITKWNYSKKNLNDENFWNNYVLCKENGNYKYLKLIK